MSQLQRKLSVRRGSVSASDPFGQHATLNHDPNRSSSSTLTIVRVLDPSSQAGAPQCAGTAPMNLSEPPAPALHRRSLRHPGTISTNADGSSTGRLSFAFSSFAPNSSAPTSSSASSPAVATSPSRRASSPSTSPRLRSSSPQFTRRQSASGSSPFSKPNLSPEQLVDLARQSTSPRYVPPPASAPSTPHLPTLASPVGSSNPAAGAITAPATFTPLPDDIYLPFIDRPFEVTQLLSTHPTTKLLSLLAQTFPRTQGPENLNDSTFSADPAKWTFGTLRLWLTIMDRQTASDTLWVRNARRCVLSHSELIWERLKGALGVPPELEVDGECDTESVIAVDDHPPRVCVSPIPAMLDAGSAAQDSGESNTRPTSFPPDDVQSTQHDSMPPSPREDPLSTTTHLLIEPILATLTSNANVSTPGSANPPPLSLPSNLSQSTSLGQGDGLQDIGEEAEDEDGADTEAPERDTQPVEDSSQIHGLRISTSPVPSSPAFVSQPFSHPTSPVMSSNNSRRNSTELKWSSEFTLPLTRRISRTSSHGSVSSLGRPTFSYIYNSAGSDFGDNDSERAHDAVGDRGPGHPLFPSNFARLALGPTLSANNPNLRPLRSSTHPVHSHFAKWAPGGRPPSWIDAWDPVKHEYAATTASGSSIGGGE
ncbi:uncharacterized protein BJ212DRAFT_1483743 [Suillus subaureus]|uniref:Uncharacterized protein n=1 Tax=Suillus subaureus TaxID=48587 RepID=A0A9P7E5I8_9AGAM|nr:uncharacterized protein BJ212DRAFT_1483743 [Suillus subaureus]KAG1811495.1 hypothetical protein BJ212DRAFT_1483743 [Suillus subaureus]